MPDFEAVVGLEVHLHLKTKSKMFCGCDANYFGDPPNTHTCPVCLGLPGVLPVVNAQAVDFGILFGLALNCQIAPWTQFYRKSYYYPDMPKNYQISQYDLPIAAHGYLVVEGQRVRIDLYESNEDMLAKLQAGGVSQYDVIVPGDYIIPTPIQLKLIQPLDKSKIPNLKNPDPKFANPPFDPGNRYSAAYQWGMSGIMYRKDRVPAPTSWGVILSPKADKPFVLMDSIREMMGGALRYLGYSINSKDPKQIQAAGKVLLEAKKNPRFLGFEGGVGAKNRLVAGTATYAVVYNGDALKAADENKNVGFVVPKEGAALFLDNMAIPAKAPNPEAAHQFINFILDAKIGAQLSNYNRYATPNKAALPFINPEDRKNPAIYPDAATMQKLEFVLDLGRDTRLYDEVWTAVKSR